MSDYYSDLEVPCDASDEQLRQAYRKMAMRWHPDKNPNSREVATKRFQQVSQAYQTLSDPQKRRAYDSGRRGDYDAEAGDREQVDPHDLFRQVFAQMQPGGHPGGVFFVSFGDGRIGMASGQHAAQPRLYELPLTLEEVFSGCQKRLRTHSIDVPQGVKDGARLASQDGKALFVVRAQPHSLFERRGLDLVHHAVLSLRQFWRGCLYEMNSIDQRRVSVRFPPRSLLELAVPGLGLRGAGGSVRGSLILRPCLVPPRVVSAIKSLAHNAVTLLLFLFCLRHPEILYMFGFF